MSDEATTAPVPQARKLRLDRLAILIAGVALLVLIPAGGVWAALFRGPHVAAGHAVQVEVPKGAGTKDIADRLVNSGVVRNPNMFRLRARLDGADGKFKPGVYDLQTGSDYGAVILRLEEGPNETYVMVTIPEGFTIDQIAERLQKRAGVNGAEFRRLATTQSSLFAQTHAFLRGDHTPTLEGYLFPKTYRVKVGEAPSDVIEMMLQQFQKETSGLDLAYAQSKNLTLHDVVTIASMVERETKLQRERPLVASVIYNRLSRHMNLEIDATVQYIVGNKRRLLYRDLEVESPYNTYLHKGLPPGPIANPGLPSIEAAANPAQTSYLYYVLTGPGSHTFTTSRAAFEAAKKKAEEGR